MQIPERYAARRALVIDDSVEDILIIRP